MRLSPNIERLRPSATIAVSTLARRLKAEGRDIIDLSAGQPDFDTPARIAQGGIDGIQGGGTRYTPTPGLTELRKAIAAYHQPDSASELDWEGVVVSCGAKHAIFNACFCLFGPGDEVLVGAPYWTSYPEIITLARAEPVPVAGPEAQGFKLDPDALEAAATERTRGLLFSSPSNPSGAVYTRDELAAVAEWARARDVWVISDEIYQRIHFGPGIAPGLLSLPADVLGPHVVINGASKSYAMTGWRIGFSYSPPELARKMTALQSHVTSNPATPSQLAALEAYGDPERTNAVVDEMVAAFRRRRDLAVRLFRELLPEVHFVPPAGAFYVYFRVDAAFGGGLGSAGDVCTAVLEEEGVAIVPGGAFGDARYARLSFATSDDLLEDGIRRIARWMRPRLG